MKSRALALLLSALTLAGMLELRAADETTATVEAKAERRGPIPVYYGKVVAPDQKESIYAIQSKYDAKIEPLAAQIRALLAERNKEIEAVLTPEQLAKVKELKIAASKAAAAKRAAAKPEEEAKPKAVGGN